MIGQAFLRLGDSVVRLDEYISDLNLDISQDGYCCQPMHKDGFAYMWAGAKATYGVRRGKVCYEVKIVENLQVSTAEFTDAHIVRVGWSTDAATLQLGEDKNSFGYGGTAKKSEGRKFADYGRRFDTGDVVGCYLSISSGWLDITYCVNGYQCGSAFKVRWDTDEVLFPHVLTKNCKIEVNFGQAHNPYFSLQPGYKLIGSLPTDRRVRAVPGPKSKEECEVIMMVGLPGVGKTTWAMNYAKLHPNKKYNILGTDAIIDKMRVQGLPRKDNFGGRWDVLIKQASECFNIMLRKASNCERNLILDQTNVYASARKRKVRQYKDSGYTVNAMVLVPTDGDMISRSTQRTIKEGKEVPEAAVYDMKANYSLPHEDENLFSSITFLELQRKDAESLVVQYNIDASLKGYKSKKQSGHGPNENQKEICERRRSERIRTHVVPAYDSKDFQIIAQTSCTGLGGSTETKRHHEDSECDRYTYRGKSHDSGMVLRHNVGRSCDDGRRSCNNTHSERSQNTSRSTTSREEAQERVGESSNNWSYSKYDGPRRSDRGDSGERRHGSKDQRHSCHDKEDSRDRGRYENSSDDRLLRRASRSSSMDHGAGNQERTPTRKEELRRNELETDGSKRGSSHHDANSTAPSNKYARQSPRLCETNTQNAPRYQDNLCSPNAFQGSFREQGMLFNAPSENLGHCNLPCAPDAGKSCRNPPEDQKNAAAFSGRQEGNWTNLANQPYLVADSLNDPLLRPLEKVHRGSRTGHDQGWDERSEPYYEQGDNFCFEVDDHQLPRGVYHLGGQGREKNKEFLLDDFHSQNPPRLCYQDQCHQNYIEADSITGVRGSVRGGADGHRPWRGQFDKHSDVEPDPYKAQGFEVHQESLDHSHSVCETLTPRLSDVDFENLKATLANVRQANQETSQSCSDLSNFQKLSSADPEIIRSKVKEVDLILHSNQEHPLPSDAPTTTMRVEQPSYAYGENCRALPSTQNLMNDKDRFHTREIASVQDKASGSGHHLNSNTHKSSRGLDRHRGGGYVHWPRSRRDEKKLPRKDFHGSNDNFPLRLKESSCYEIHEREKEMIRQPPPRRRTLLKTPLCMTDRKLSVSWPDRRAHKQAAAFRRENEVEDPSTMEYHETSEILPSRGDWDEQEAVQSSMHDSFKSNRALFQSNKSKGRKEVSSSNLLERQEQPEIIFPEDGGPRHKSFQRDFSVKQRPHRSPLLETPDIHGQHSRPQSKVNQGFLSNRVRGNGPRLRPRIVHPIGLVYHSSQYPPKFPMSERPPRPSCPGLNPSIPRMSEGSGLPRFRAPRMEHSMQGGRYERSGPWHIPRQMQPRSMHPFIRR